MGRRQYSYLFLKLIHIIQYDRMGNTTLCRLNATQKKV
jgi:hypothetical protein